MKQTLHSLLLLLFFSSLANAQITYEGCFPEMNNGGGSYETFTFFQTSSGGTPVRNTYETTPIDGGQPCNTCFGFGYGELRIIWDAGDNRWELELTGDGTTWFTIFYNASASAPNPPDLSLGTWVENVSVTSGGCGGDGINSLTGNVQSSLGGTSPEIDVLGNGSSIADGDGTPSPADDTDFGQVSTLGNDIHTFTIDNTAGTADLSVTSINLSGTNSGDFTIGGVTLPATILAGGTTTFTVTFAPGAVGVRTATLTVNNDDADESVYDFAIEGEGIAPAPATALDFDGVDDYVDISNPFTAYTNEITVEWWVNTNNIITSGQGIGQSAPDVDDMLSNVWLMHGNGGGTMTFYVNDNGTWRSASAPNINGTGWRHIAGVADASGVRIYLDGVLAGSSGVGIASGIQNAPTSHIHLGKDPRYAVGRFLDCQIDEVRVWNVTRTLAQIGASKDCELNGNECGLVAYYDFNQGFANGPNTSETTLLDRQTNIAANNGTLNNFDLMDGATISNWIDGTANGVSGTCTPPSLPEVMVTEFLADPSGTDATDEWVEITNYGAVSYDLNGWTIEDEGADNDPIASASTTIAAGESYILARNKAQFESLWLGGCSNPYVLEVAGLTLANGPDEIIIKDDNGCRVHQVSFIGDERIGRATWYTEAFPPTTRVWGANGVDEIDRQGNDAATGTLGYEENSTTADPNMRQANAVADFGSPLANNYAVAEIVRGNALEFDGTNQIVDMGNQAAFNITNNITLEAWVNISSAPADQKIITKFGDIGGDDAYSFQLNNGDPSIALNFPTGWTFVSSGMTMNLNQWYHLAASYDGSVIRIYVNGVEMNAVAQTGAIDISASTFKLGGWAGTQYFDGSMDEVRVWNVARSADEIRENMHLSIPVCETGLVSYFQLNEGSGTTVSDVNSGLDGTFVGVTNPTWAVSGVNLGNGGGSNSETISNVTVGVSIQTFAAANMTIRYLEHSAVEDVTVTYQEFTPNTTAGASGVSVFDNPMWTVNSSTSGATQHMNLTFSFVSAPFTGVTDGSKYRLYWRPMYDDGNWQKLDGQAIIVSATDIQFTGLYVTGQFMVVEASTGEVSDVRGNMYNFDGGNWIDATATATGLPVGDDSRSVEAWIKTTQTSIGNIVSWGNRTNNNRHGFAVRNNSIAFIGQFNDYTGTVAVNDGTWHHVAMTYNSATSTMVFYIDGEVINSFGASNLNTINQNLRIGTISVPSSGENYVGSLDEVRIWNDARTQAEIRANMHLTLKGDEADLVSYYQFNNDDAVTTPNGVKDAINGNDGTTVNMVAADYVASEVAVAGGVSDIVNVTGTGDVNFPNTGVTINFNTTPNGEVVVSRLQTEKPTGWGTVGGDVDNEYFVVWNYGTDQNPVVDVMTFNGISHIPSTTANSEIALYKRGSREYGATWGTALANAASIVNQPVADVRFGSGGLTSGFSQFVIVNNAANADLPIELMAFDANRRSTDEVLLDWQTASELNNQGFYIERMLENETEFNRIGWIDGFGTTSEITHYEYNDDNAYTGVSYYRLLQVDFDGTETFSEVHAVNGSDLNVFSDVNIYPVPVREELTLSFGKLPKGVNSGQVRIVDVQGRVIYDATVGLASHQVLLIEDAAEWASGMYLLQVQLDNGSSMLEKFVKE